MERLAYKMPRVVRTRNAVSLEFCSVRLAISLWHGSCPTTLRRVWRVTVAANRLEFFCPIDAKLTFDKRCAQLDQNANKHVGKSGSETRYYRIRLRSGVVLQDPIASPIRAL